jgi:hypothetical protein
MPLACTWFGSLTIQDEEELPYSFFINGVEILDSVGTSIDEQKLSAEEVMNIVYQPQVSGNAD